MTKAEELARFGQSIWLDNINRQLIEEGALEKMVGLGLKGLTSNPSIFEKAITGSVLYDKKISHMHKAGKSLFDIYDELTIKDIKDAADIFSDLYKETNGKDGYVSLEINPRLAFNVKDTMEEARRLYNKVNRPNLMLKVPATEEGFSATEELIALGMNVNATLIFSEEQYVKTAQAYIRGLKRLSKTGKDITGIHSVASVFVSRVDTVVDGQLEYFLSVETEGNMVTQLKALQGKAAVANSKLIYGKFLDIFSSAEFAELKKKGANLQRLLWGSTSTKNPAYSDIKYVAELIAKDTVNTMPEATWEAFLDHGIVKEAIRKDGLAKDDTIPLLSGFGIDVKEICKKLLDEGITAFQKSFSTLLKSIEDKARNTEKIAL